MAKRNGNSGPTGPAKKSWVELAGERNARVVLCHTPDTYMLADLTRAADRAIRYLRDQAFSFLTVAEVEPLFEEYIKSVIALHRAIANINRTVKIDYKPSRALAKWLESQGENFSSDSVENDKPV